MADKIDCDIAKIPFIHLRVLVGQIMTRVSTWASISDRFRSRLLGWKAKTLSIGGRLTLVKSVLGSLGSYLMSNFLTPILVLSSLVALMDRVFWGAELDERHMHWVRCDNVLVAKEEV